MLDKSKKSLSIHVYSRKSFGGRPDKSVKVLCIFGNGLSADALARAWECLCLTHSLFCICICRWNIYYMHLNIFRFF